MQTTEKKQSSIRTKWNHYVKTMSVGRAVIATVIFAVFSWLINFSPIGVSGLLEVTGGANILDFEAGYTVDYAYGMLEALGEAGRQFHLMKIMPLDIVFPIGLMLFLTSWTCFFLKALTKENSVFRLLPLIAVINMLLDWCENIGITLMLMKFPKWLVTVCRVTSAVSTAKMICVGSAAVLLCVLLISYLVQKLFRLVRRK